MGWSLGRVVLIGAVGIAAVSIGYNILHAPEKAKESAASVSASPMGGRTNDPEAVIRELRDRVGANPKDAEGWQMLGWAYFENGRHADAVSAYRHATKLMPDNATFWSSLGEAAAMASEHDPMPREASDAFDKAIALDPKDPRARYFLAVRKDLARDHEGAIRDWLALLGDTPPGAPWEADLRRTIEQVGKINRIDVAQRLAAVKPAAPHPAVGSGGMSVATAAIPGPTSEQMQAAAQLPKGQQDAMVEGMVASLEAKLKANPAHVDGWIMLMRSRMTLGETTKAAAAYAQAQAANPTQAGRIRDEARILGVPGA
ncbi:cytochrome c-type biogenesis protein CcmH [Sphingobium faniae]|nr:cytochrome c-type biogenesis protein CcmH [Sphingobium faniae]